MPAALPSLEGGEEEGVGESREVIPGGGGEGRIINPREIMAILAGFFIVGVTLVLGRVNASVILITSSNESFSFSDEEATFAPKVPTTGVIGVLYAANPSNACKSLQSQHLDGRGVPTFLLAERGDCSFVAKVQNAQDAGYAAIIVYDNVDGDDLVTMSGSAENIEIFAAFVSKKSGQVLLQYAEDLGSRCLILPALENTAWSVMAVSFISFFAVSAVLSVFYLVRRNRYRQMGFQFWSREPISMSTKEVRALPVVVFDSAGNPSMEACAICLEDYMNAEKLRVLPCHHEFHVACIDQWLTTQRPFCPICKRDAHMSKSEVGPTERTPLLGSLTRFWECSTSSPVRSRHQSENHSSSLTSVVVS